MPGTVRRAVPVVDASGLVVALDRTVFWLWALQDEAGTNASLLANALSRKVTFKRSGMAEATFELDLQDDDAYVVDTLLKQGTPRLRCFRVEFQQDSSALALCRFGGILSSVEEQADDSTMKVTARGPMELLDGRSVGAPDAPWARDLQDVGATMAELVTYANAEQDTGIIIGGIQPSVPLDVTYEGKVIGDGFTELASTDGGPDFEFVPVADDTGQGFTLARLEVYTVQGQEKPQAVFGYGDGTVSNCTDATRNRLRPRNRVYVYGDEGLVGYAEDLQSQAQHGIWEYNTSLADVIDQNLLDSNARELLRPNWQQLVTFQPDPAKVDTDGEPITPSPWLDYWLGDDVPLSVRKGAFVFDGDVRVDGIDIDIDDDGFEASHTVAVATDD